MKLRLKIIECIQSISFLSIIVSATLIIGGAEFASTEYDFMWQFWTGIACVLFSGIIAGMMELLIRYELHHKKN